MVSGAVILVGFSRNFEGILTKWLVQPPSSDFWKEPLLKYQLYVKCGYIGYNWEQRAQKVLSLEQTDATLLEATCCVRLHTLLHFVACCCIRLNTTATRTQQHAKLLAQQCCELLRPFTSSLRMRGKSWILMWPVKLKTVIAWTNCDAKIFKDSLALVPWRVCCVFDIEDNCWLAESLYKDFSSEFLKTRKAKVRGKPLP